MDDSAFLSGERTPLLGPASTISSKVLSETKVYPLIHLIRVDVLAHIDTPLTYDQLLAPDSTYTIVRPLTEKYLQLQNQSIIFCLLLNKVQFGRDSTQLSISTLSLSRATLCEILAIRVLRGWSERSLPLATVLLTPWALFQGASETVVECAKEDWDEELLEQGGNALEMAIISSSKRFIRSPSCQKVIEGIWSGHIIYSAMNAHALIADNYKKKPIQIYNPHKAALLDHYRLKVPKVRSFLEYSNFLVLFILYVICIEGMEEDRLNAKELVFIVYALAYSLDKLAAVREHGLKVFSSSLVNGFDLVFMLIYAVYLSARTYGFHYDNADALSLGADWLAIGAVLIFPRLAFVTLANNLMVLSIRSMLTEFFFLMGIGIFCFLGFLYALFTLGQGRFELSQIGWWLLEVYFGLDASGFEAAHNFHPFLGPLLMVTYALLSNTLLLTVLVAILGNTFATINADAAAESMFRKAVATLEGVKADAVFSYQLPFNLVALAFMWPMSYILSPRWFHKVNVFMIRASNLPVLLIIALYERQQYRDTSLLEQLGDFTERYVGTLPRRLKQAAGFDNFGSKYDIGAVFEIEREVGDFYKGWDDDMFDDDLQLPSPAEGDEGLSSTEEGKSRAVDGRPMPLFPQSEPLTASPARLPNNQTSAAPDTPTQALRQRRKSVPASAASAQPSPIAPLPAFRRRRNSSIQEPSPLARLFLGTSEAESSIVNRLRERRQSLANALSSSVSQPNALASILSPPSRQRTKSHSRTNSQPATGTSSALTGSRPGNGPAAAVPSIAPIEEGKKATFSEIQPRKGPVRIDESVFSPTSTTGGGGSIPFPAGPSRKETPTSARRPEPDEDEAKQAGDDKVAKASDVEARQIREGYEGEQMGQRLVEMEKRQKRIEELLEKLVNRREDSEDRERSRTNRRDSLDDAFIGDDA